MYRRFLLIVCLATVATAGELNVWEAKPEIRTVESGAAIKLIGDRNNDLYRSRLTNTGTGPVHVKEVALFRIMHDLPDETSLYGESFQMLSQTAGTLGKPVDLGCNELSHYKMAGPRLRSKARHRQRRSEITRRNGARAAVITNGPSR